MKLHELESHLKSGGLIKLPGFAITGLYTPKKSSTLGDSTFYVIVGGKKRPTFMEAYFVFAPDWQKCDGLGNVYPDVKQYSAVLDGAGEQTKSADVASDGGRIYSAAEISVKYRKLRDEFREYIA